MEYSDVVWDNCTEKDSKMLEDVQVEAGRIITGLRYNSSRTKLYDDFYKQGGRFINWYYFIKL